MNFSQIATATEDQLRVELAAACQDSSHAGITTLREAVARQMHDFFGPFDLCDSESNDVIRDATEDEAVDSVLAGPEGHILIDGRRCYVAE